MIPRQLDQVASMKFITCFDEKRTVSDVITVVTARTTNHSSGFCDFPVMPIDKAGYLARMKTAVI